MTNVLILTGHQAFGERLETFVRDQLRCTVSGRTMDAAAALELMRETRPDVALVDAALPGESGFELTPRLIALHPGARVVIMGNDELVEYRHAAVQVGALAYIPKAALSQRLPDVLGITAVDPEGRRSITASPRGLVLQGVLSGGALMSGVAIGQPTAAMAGALAVVILLHWHSARGRRSPHRAWSASSAALTMPLPGGGRLSRADGIRGSPERGENL